MPTATKKSQPIRSKERNEILLKHLIDISLGVDAPLDSVTYHHLHHAQKVWLEDYHELMTISKLIKKAHQNFLNLYLKK